MNVWLLLWLTHHAHYSQTQNINLLLIDAFNLGHNFDDDPFSSPFYTPYFKIFKNILQGSAFRKYHNSLSSSSSKLKSATTTTVCLQRVLLQPQPSKPFIWDSWFKDNGCSFIGPSTLFQRWNLAIRSAYGLNGLDNGSSVRGLDSQSISFTSSVASASYNNGGYSIIKSSSSPSSPNNINNDKIIRIILISRTATTNRWGNERTSRNILNMDALIQTITQSAVKAFPHHIYSDNDISGSNHHTTNNKHKIEVIAVAFEKLKSFEDQVRMAATASIIIGKKLLQNDWYIFFLFH